MHKIFNVFAKFRQGCLRLIMKNSEDTSFLVSKLLHTSHKEWQSMEQATQGGHELFLSGDTQNPPGCIPV